MKINTNNLAFIVEDNEMFSKMLNHTLSKGSVCHLKSFKSGEECINNLYMNPFVIIMDYMLPGINGLKTFKIIKKYNPDIPVVVLTGTKDEEIASDFLNAGAHAYIVKQKSTPYQMIKIINNLLVIASNGNKNSTKGNNSFWGHFKVLISILFFTVAIATIVMLYFSEELGKGF